MTIGQERRTPANTSIASTNEWSPLTSVYAELLGPEPTVIRFPNGDKREAGTWHDMYAQVASWLVMQGKINTPVSVGGTRYLVNDVHFHDHEPFDRSFELPNGMWLEGGGNSQLVIDRAVMLLEMFEVDPASVGLLLGQRGDDGWIR